METGITTKNISQSDRIGQDSTIVVFFEQKDNILTLYLTKSRDSVNGKVLKYYVDFNQGLFEFIPEETDALNGSKCKDLKEEFEEIEDSNEENPF